MRKLHWLLAVAILLASPSAALAQRSTATVRGTVRDATQAVLPGVTVTVTNEETGLVREVTTNAEGVYVAPELPIGRYKIDAQLQGFKRAIAHGHDAQSRRRIRRGLRARRPATSTRPSTSRPLRRR